MSFAKADFPAFCLSRFRLALMALILAFCGALHAEAKAPDAVIHDVSEDILQILRTDPAIKGGDKEKAKKIVYEKILPVVHIRRTAQLVLARHWGSANSKQKDDFTIQFRDFLINSYATALTEFENEKVKYSKAAISPSGKTATVKTVVIRSNGQEIPVDYYLEKTPDGWRIYDVAIENVRMVINYRNTFDQKIREKGLDGLIAELADKNRRGIAEPPPRQGG